MKIKFNYLPFSIGAISVTSATATLLTGQYLLVASVACIALGSLAAVWSLSRQSAPPKIPLFQTKRPAPLDLRTHALAAKSVSSFAKQASLAASSDVFLTPLSSPLSSPKEFLTPRLSPKAECQTLPPAQQLPTSVLPGISSPPPSQMTLREKLSLFVRWIAEMSDNQLLDPQTQKQIEQEVKDFVLIDSWNCLREIRQLYKEDEAAHKFIDQILDKNIIFSLIQEPISHTLHYFRASQKEIFTFLGEKNYESLVLLFLKTLDQKPSIAPQPSVERNLEKTVKKRLAELLEFIATTWTASFAREATRTQLLKLIDALEDADPMDCLRELRTLYQEKNGVSRKHLDLLLQPSMISNPGASLRKECVFQVAGFISKHLCKIINVPLRDLCALMGSQKYKSLIQQFLTQKPSPELTQIREFAGSCQIDIDLGF